MEANKIYIITLLFYINYTACDTSVNYIALLTLLFHIKNEKTYQVLLLLMNTLMQ